MRAKPTWQEYLSARHGARVLIAVVALVLAGFQIYTGVAGALDAYMQRSLHLALGLTLTFLVYPAVRRQGSRLVGMLVDVLLIAGVLGATAYILLEYRWITAERYMLISDLSLAEKVLGIIVILAVLEAVRRVVGNVLLGVVLAFVIYPFIGPYLPGVFHTTTIHWTEFIDLMFLTPEGVYGIPLGVSSREIAVFILFAAFIVRTDVSTFLFDVAASVAGRSRGGPAKVAVISSALMGTLSGSGTANVVTTGSITIPMMKRIGYKPHFAGAVEAVASTGGQIMPPVMGATAFVMVAFTGIPYAEIMRYAIFPAVLYFAALLMGTHLEACKLNLPGVEPSQSAWNSFKQYGHMVIPIGLLVYLLVIGYSPVFAASYSLMALIVVSMLQGTTRLNLVDVLEAMESGARAMLVVIAATAAAGIIVGSVNITGLGNRLGSAVMAMSGGNLLIALVLTMLVAILLGMGMPTTPAYIIQATFMIPALVQMGLPVYAAHLFAFYFACLSLITPPVAITAYAAAGIAGSDVMRTGFTAFRLGLSAYIIPFMFAYGPALLLVGEWWRVAAAAVTALIGVWCLTMGVLRYYMRPLSRVEQALAIAASLLLIFPKIVVSLPGLAIFAFLWANQRWLGLWQAKPAAGAGARVEGQ